MGGARRAVYLTGLAPFQLVVDLLLAAVLVRDGHIGINIVALEILFKLEQRFSRHETWIGVHDQVVRNKGDDVADRVGDVEAELVLVEGLGEHEEEAPAHEIDRKLSDQEQLPVKGRPGHKPPAEEEPLPARPDLVQEKAVLVGLDDLVQLLPLPPGLTSLKPVLFEILVVPFFFLVICLRKGSLNFKFFLCCRIQFFIF